MNTYLARSICNDLGNSIRQFCSCNSVHWQRVCVATCIASLLPVSFILQMTAFMIDQWAIPEEYAFLYNDTFACMNSEHPDARICGLGITVCSAELLLVCFGFGVCVRSCFGSFDLQSCSFCYVCFIPTLSLIHGILSVALCIITTEYVSQHKQYEYTFGLSYYMFLITGCTTIVVSLTSVCGFLCFKLCDVRQNYQHEIGSDDADQETTSIINAMA